MNNADSEKLRGVLELLVDSGNRINQAKPQKYWYPLSQANYGVDEILEAVDSMCSFRTSMWEKTAEFEAAFAAYNGSKHAVMVNSGSSADLLMCLALTAPGPGQKLKPGDEVLIPAVTWPTQIWSAMMAGLKVKLVDVNLSTLNSTSADFEKAVTPETRAIFTVHLMGIASDLSATRRLCEKNNLVLIEDCCEAMGTVYDKKKVGNHGLMGAYSFFFAHHITTMEGGMVVTDDDAIANQLRVLRAHGWVRNITPAPDLGQYDVDPRYAFVNWGLNVRPTELQAGFGLHQIKQADAWTDRRRSLAYGFVFELNDRENLRNHLRFPTWEAHTCQPSFFALPLVASSRLIRNRITRHLEKNGVETRPMVAGNIARHPVGELFGCFGDFLRTPAENVALNADEIHQRGFYIGLSPLNTHDDIMRVILLLEDFFK